MSKSLLVNVLDMEDNYKLGLGQPSFTASHTVPDIADVYRRRCSSNIIPTRTALVLTLSCHSSKSPLPPSSSDEFSAFQPLQRELNLILKEIRVSCFLMELEDITTSAVAGDHGQDQG